MGLVHRGKSRAGGYRSSPAGCTNSVSATQFADVAWQISRHCSISRGSVLENCIENAARNHGDTRLTQLKGNASPVHPTPRCRPFRLVRQTIIPPAVLCLKMDISFPVKENSLPLGTGAQPTWDESPPDRPRCPKAESGPPEHANSPGNISVARPHFTAIPHAVRPRRMRRLILFGKNFR